MQTFILWRAIEHALVSEALENPLSYETKSLGSFEKFLRKLCIELVLHLS